MSIIGRQTQMKTKDSLHKNGVEVPIRLLLLFIMILLVRLLRYIFTKLALSSCCLSSSCHSKADWIDPSGR